VALDAEQLDNGKAHASTCNRLADDAWEKGLRTATHAPKIVQFASENSPWFGAVRVWDNF
jgi:hypothetical protein